MANPKYPPHPLVGKLTSGKDDTGAVKLLGYFGSSADGVIKVYPSLDDLSVYYEIREADILHVEDAPEQELPHGGSAIWVKADASVERCVNERMSMEARFLAGEIAAYMSKGPAVGYRGLARQVPIVPETGGGPACDYSNVWPCSVLVGVCLASNDMPCAYTEQYWCPTQVVTAQTCFTCAGFTCVRDCYSVGCPPTQKFCTGGRFTLCGCQVFSRDVCGNRG